MDERLRMCIVCRARLDKRSLKRVVRSPEGVIDFDPTGKSSGRGAYVCSSECMVKCAKLRMLNKAFKCEVDKDVYQRLTEEF